MNHPCRRTTRFLSVLTRDQLALPVQPFMRAAASLLHSLRSAGATLSLVLPAALVRLPGADTLLAEFSGCELIAVPDGFAAMALSQALQTGALPLQAPDASGAVPLLRRCEHSIEAPAADVSRTRLGTSAQAVAPTHVLYEGRAMAIGAAPLEIGRAAGGSSRITLPEGLAGVSRLHGTLRREAQQVMLIDHSRFGTFVNGERVTGCVALHAGDRVRIGDPGIELAMIAVGESYAPSPPD